MKTYKQLFDENGKYKLDESYTEILKLDKMLTEANVPHTLKRFLDGWQVVYSVNGKIIADAIQHRGSYGNEENLLEIMGLLTAEEEQHDSVKGWLTAEDVFNRISKHYNSLNRERQEPKWDNVFQAFRELGFSEKRIQRLKEIAEKDGEEE